MEDINKLFWNCDINEMKRGYIWNEDKGVYICLICGESYEEGVVYSQEDKLYTAQRALRNHISKEHGSVFKYLMDLNKRYTGMTDIQREMLGYFYKGLSDKEIVKIQGSGSTSTIRNHRFKLKERQKQSKVFLALMELLNEKNSEKPKSVSNLETKKNKDEFVPVHKGATMVDDRFAITKEEKEKVLERYFKDGKLTALPSKEKRRIMILQHIIEDFEPNRKYTEKEINEIIKSKFYDYVTIRRYFIQYGFMDRAIDGSAYWLKL